MPWPEVTVPKFGDWDDNGDLSYSVVFDKARADKERYLPTYHKEEQKYGPICKDGSRFSDSTTSHHVRFGRRLAEPGDNMFDVPHGGQIKVQSDPWNSLNVVSDTNVQVLSSGQRIVHERIMDKIPGSLSGIGRPQYQGSPVSVSISRSQQRLEDFARVDAPENVVVPKFGDWEALNGTSGDDFTVIFNKVRDEKKAHFASEATLKTASPIQAHEDLYQNKSISKVRKKENRWFNMFCCRAPIHD